MKVSVSRSFSHKIQLVKFENYIEPGCAVSIEFNIPDNAKEELVMQDVKQMSDRLDEFVRGEVEHTITIFRPAVLPIHGKSEAEKKDISKTEAEFEAGDG